jgi:hypothetical protein
MKKDSYSLQVKLDVLKALDKGVTYRKMTGVWSTCLHHRSAYFDVWFPHLQALEKTEKTICRSR